MIRGKLRVSRGPLITHLAWEEGRAAACFFLINTYSAPRPDHRQAARKVRIIEQEK